MKKIIEPNDAYRIRSALKKRNIVFVGMMGSGKSAIGKRLAYNLDIPFVDADNAIEEAAGMSISDIFNHYGEDYFRDGERKVIARLIGEGPAVLATGGGAFMNDETRTLIKNETVSIWLKASLEILLERVLRKDTRPLLKQGDPETIMRTLLDKRNPVYKEADLEILSGNQSHEEVVTNVVDKLLNHLEENNAN